MRKVLFGLWFLFWIAIVVSLQLIACGQNVSAPESVGNGEAIKFQFLNHEPGDVIRWEVLNPFPEPQVKVIKSQFGDTIVVDPPINWRGIVRVQCFVMDYERRVKHFETEQVAVDWDTEEPLPPGPGPIDPPIAEYDGPNVFGVGKVSFDNAPGYEPGVVEIYRKASEYIYGRPNLKVIYTQDPALNSSDFNVIVWSRRQMETHYPGWDKWHNSVFEQIQKSDIKAGSKIEEWHQVFLEAAAGVEARK